MGIELTDEQKIKSEIFWLRVNGVVMTLSILYIFLLLHKLNLKVDTLIANQPEAPTYKTEMLLDIWRKNGKY